MATQEITVQAQDIRTFSLGKSTSPASSPATGPSLGTITTCYVPLGPSNALPGQEVTVTITGFQFSTPVPAIVRLQARQGDNQEFGFPDEFAAQVITTASDRIVCRIRRL